MKKTLAILLLIISFFIVYFLQSNIFTWFTIGGVMPNLYVIYVLFIGLFVKKKYGFFLGMAFGLYLDVIFGKTVGISTILFGIIGILGEIFSKNFSKDSRLTIMLMVMGVTVFYEVFAYVINTIINQTAWEILPFIRILLVEVIFNTLLTIILYPLMKRLGYKLEEIFGDKISLTRYF